MWKVWITAFENVDFTHFSTFLPVENTVFVNYLTIALGLCQVFFCYKKRDKNFVTKGYKMNIFSKTKLFIVLTQRRPA